MIWVVFAVCMSLLALLVLGGLCAAAGRSEREIERLTFGPASTESPDLPSRPLGSLNSQGGRGGEI